MGALFANLCAITHILGRNSAWRERTPIMCVFTQIMGCTVQHLSGRLAFRLAPVRTIRIRRVSTVVIGVVALLPAVILGWLSTVTVVVWWGLGLGLASVALSALGPYRKAREDEPAAGSRRS